MNAVLNANMNESSNKLEKGFYPNTELGIDRNGKVVKNVTSGDSGDVEDPDKDPNGGGTNPGGTGNGDNPGGGSQPGNTEGGNTQGGNTEGGKTDTGDTGSEGGGDFVDM